MPEDALRHLHATVDPRLDERLRKSAGEHCRSLSGEIRAAVTAYLAKQASESAKGASE